MFSNPKSKTRIIVFNNRTVVVSRVESYPNQFRVYIDSVNYGILTFADGEWSLTAGYNLPKGVFTLLTKRIGIGDWIDEDQV